MTPPKSSGTSTSASLCPATNRSSSKRNTCYGPRPRRARGTIYTPRSYSSSSPSVVPARSTATCRRASSGRSTPKKSPFYLTSGLSTCSTSTTSIGTSPPQTTTVASFANSMTASVNPCRPTRQPIDSTVTPTNYVSSSARTSW